MPAPRARTIGARAVRTALALLLAGTLAACGAGSQAGPDARTDDPEGPTASPPALKGSGPPLAWAESGTAPDQRVWLAFSSYCWDQVCADYVAPSNRDDIPVLRATFGSQVVFHLGFEPTSIGLQIADGRESLQLTGTGREHSWTADRSALLLLNATDAATEQASYAIRVSLDAPSFPPEAPDRSQETPE
jgi:hypothetical protein